MSSKLQDKQAMLEKGMKVFLLVKGYDVNSPPKRRPARVVQVMRGAARISIEGEKERVVKLADLDIDMEAYNARAMRKVAGDGGVPELQLQQAERRIITRSGEHPNHATFGPPKSVHVQAVNPAIPSAPALKAKVEDDLETWLNMGRELLAPLKARCAQIEESLGCLHDEKAAIEDEIASLKEEIDGLYAKQRVINGKVSEMEKAS